MNRTLSVSFLLPLLLLGCTSRNPEARSPATAADSARAADSTARATMSLPAGIALSYGERQGGALYDKYCAVCHGKEGKGDGFNAFNLDPRPRDFSDSTYMGALSDGQIERTISGGGRSVNKSPLMPSYGGTISPRELGYITSYIRTFSVAR